MKLKLLSNQAKVPTYATQGAAAFDIYSAMSVVVEPGGCAIISTDIAVELEPYQAMFIYSRSGMGFKHGVRLANCVGVIDADYRGEIMVALHNDGQEPYIVAVGDRIAQGVVMPFVPVHFDEVETLADSERGEGGFGSSGK